MAETETHLDKVLPLLLGLSIDDLGKLIEAAEKARAAAVESGRATFLQEMRERAQSLGLSIEDLVQEIGGASGRKQRGDAGKKVAPKYRGPDGGEWTGRGRAPTWLTTLETQGRKRDEFLIAS